MPKRAPRRAPRSRTSPEAWPPRSRTLRAALAPVLEELAGAIDFPEEVPEPDRSIVRGALDRRRSSGSTRLLRAGEAGGSCARA